MSFCQLGVLFFLGSLYDRRPMKPKELKFPFAFQERRPHLGNGILFVPRHYYEHEAFEFPPFYTLFKNNNPVHVEYCSGNGLWICDRAQQMPDKNWVAVEKDFERVRKIYSKKMNQNISNLFVVCGFAEPFARYYIPRESVHVTHINFPDPWPKERHAKHRIVQQPFMEDVMQTMAPLGEIHLVTDDAPYAEQMKEVMSHLSECAAVAIDEHLPENHAYGISWFERLWRSKGREIIHLHYRREIELCLSR